MLSLIGGDELLFSFVLVDAMVDAHSIASRKYLFLFIRITDRRFGLVVFKNILNVPRLDKIGPLAFFLDMSNYSIKMTIQSHRARMVSSIVQSYQWFYNESLLLQIKFPLKTNWACST